MFRRQNRRALSLIVSAAVLLTLAVGPAVVSAGTGDFDDVPRTNVFYNDIAWMADSGVTAGCGSARFCPDDSVTREQMAAFMHRLAKNQVVDAGSLGGVSAADYVTHSEIGTGAIDADTVDGLHASSFLRSGAKAVDSDKLDGQDSSAFLAATAGSRAWGDVSLDLDDVDGVALGARITSPANGMVIVGANIDLTAFTGSDDVQCWLTVNGEPINGTMMYVTVDAIGSSEGICGTSGILTVSSGIFDLEVVIVRTFGTAALFAGTLWAQWIPFDGGGAVPTLDAGTYGVGTLSDKLPTDK